MWLPGNREMTERVVCSWLSFEQYVDLIGSVFSQIAVWCHLARVEHVFLVVNWQLPHYWADIKLQQYFEGTNYSAAGVFSQSECGWLCWTSLFVDNPLWRWRHQCDWMYWWFLVSSALWLAAIVSIQMMWCCMSPPPSETGATMEIFACGIENPPLRSHDIMKDLWQKQMSLWVLHSGRLRVWIKNVVVGLLVSHMTWCLHTFRAVRSSDPELQSWCLFCSSGFLNSASSVTSSNQTCSSRGHVNSTLVQFVGLKPKLLLLFCDLTSEWNWFITLTEVNRHTVDVCPSMAGRSLDGLSTFYY